MDESLFQLLFVGGFYFSSSSLLHNSRLCLEQRVGECCCPSIFMNILHNWPSQTCLIIITAMKKTTALLHLLFSVSLMHMVVSSTPLLLRKSLLIYYNGLLWDQISGCCSQLTVHLIATIHFLKEAVRCSLRWTLQYYLWSLIQTKTH